jgi:CheY-like chemotaxis protein
VAIDDERATLDELERALTRADYDVMRWTSPTGAALFVRTIQPDLVLLELHMQGDAAAGLKVLTELRGEPSTAQIPAILMAVSPDSVCDGQEALAAQGCFRLEKPWGPEALQEALARVLPSGT